MVKQEHIWDVYHPLAGLDQYKRAMLNAISRVEMMAKWPLRARSMTPIFNTSWENPNMHNWSKFGDFNSNPLQVIMGVKPNFLENSKSKWPKWPWRSKSMTSIFNISWEYPRMYVWCKFGDPSSNLWPVTCVWTRSSLWTDGRADRHRQWQYPFKKLWQMDRQADGWTDKTACCK